MQESQIILHLLFPAHEEATRPIDPGMAAFHHRTASTIARSNVFLSFLFPSTAHMWLIVPCQQLLIDWSGVVGGIQAQVLRLLWRGLGSADDQSIEGGAEQFHIMAIGPIHYQSQRDSDSIGQQTPLGSPFAAIRGIGSGRGVAERGFGHHSVRSLPFPLDANQIVILTQSRLPQGFEEACLFRLLKPIMYRRTGS